MARRANNVAASIAQRLAFLSLSDSDTATVKAEAILWTLRTVGFSDEKIVEITEQAEALAKDAQE